MKEQGFRAAGSGNGLSAYGSRMGRRCGGRVRQKNPDKPEGEFPHTSLLGGVGGGGHCEAGMLTAGASTPAGGFAPPGGLAFGVCTSGPFGAGAPVQWGLPTPSPARPPVPTRPR